MPEYYLLSCLPVEEHASDGMIGMDGDRLELPACGQ